jgi:SAM-dependent methyltransferase
VSPANGVSATGSGRDKPIAEALLNANRIAFGPMMFQAARALWKLGVLDSLHRLRDASCRVEDVACASGLSEYAARLLLDAGASQDLVRRDCEHYRLTKTGFIWLTDETVHINADFVHDLCYRAFFHFEEAMKSGQPSGLREFGDWSSIYPAVPSLPDPARESWYRFDHRYSDAALPRALDLLLEQAPARVLDIGGNTGRFARSVTARCAALEVCIVDLPAQVREARLALAVEPASERISFVEMDVLDAGASFPSGFDAIWVSQFLDCFSEDQIVSLLRRMQAALLPGGAIYVLEPCPDDQCFEAAAYSLNATSLYFACVANGNSRLYFTTDWERMFARAGLRVVRRDSGLGICQTLFRCCPL